MIIKKIVLNLLITLLLTACSDEKSEIWEIDNLEQIGGHDVTVIGNPEVVETEIGRAVEFDGEGDMLLVDYNPIGEAEAYTVEVVFKQNATYPENTAPRFIHIQDPDDKEQKRLMIELRLNDRNECYLDGYMQTDSMSLVLIDERLVHPTGQWLHAAVTYKDGVMTTYMNGKRELSGHITYADTLINPSGKVAIGGRMNHVSWFNGYIKTLKITHESLDPGNFFTLPRAD